MRGNAGRLTDEWTAGLDALEEWVRRSREQAATGLALPSLEPLPAGPLPDEHRFRALVLLESMRLVEAGVQERRQRLVREHAYRS